MLISGRAYLAKVCTIPLMSSESADVISAYLAGVCISPLMSSKSADVISDVISTCHAIIVQ